MPRYRYGCRVCKHEFFDERTIADRQNTSCPECETWGGAKIADEETQLAGFAIEILVPLSFHVRTQDVTEKAAEREGAVEMAPGYLVKNERERKQYMKDVRERLIERTSGTHRFKIPVENNRGGYDIEIHEREGKPLDVGEITDARDFGEKGMPETKEEKLARWEMAIESQKASNATPAVPKRLKKKMAKLAKFHAEQP